jgi:transposase
MAAQGGAVMAKPILDDWLWELIEPLLPPPKKRRKRYPGRKPIANREALSAILFVLKTGLPWEYLPQELGWGSGMTAWRRLYAWQRIGVWKKIHETMLMHLQEADKIDWSRAIVDSSSVRAVHGGKKRDQTQRIAANPAANIMWSRTPTAFRSRPR